MTTTDWGLVNFGLACDTAELSALDAVSAGPAGREADVLRVVASRLLAKASAVDEFTPVGVS